MWSSSAVTSSGVPSEELVVAGAGGYLAMKAGDEVAGDVGPVDDVRPHGLGVDGAEDEVARGIATWPYVVATVALGSIGILAYCVRRGFTPPRGT